MSTATWCATSWRNNRAAPICIKFGTRDGSTTPEWTAYAWKQTKELRDHLQWGDKIIFAEFDGTHEVKGEEAFDFVDKHLGPAVENR